MHMEFQTTHFIKWYENGGHLATVSDCSGCRHGKLCLRKRSDPDRPPDATRGGHRLLHIVELDERTRIRRSAAA
jgi:hypothetical protein